MGKMQQVRMILEIMMVSIESVLFGTKLSCIHFDIVCACYCTLWSISKFSAIAFWFLGLFVNVFVFWCLQHDRVFNLVLLLFVL